MGKLMYITGSFPRLGDGIGDASGKLYDAIEDKTNVELVTSNVANIKEYVKEKQYCQVWYVDDWKYKTINMILGKIKKDKINKVLIEYAGNGYRKDLAISFLPLRIRIRNIFLKEKVQCHLRVHEFSMCRAARKIFTYPLLLFCHHIDTPSYVEYDILKKKFGKKIKKTAIGSNFDWINKKKARNHDNKKITIAFFGCIYPGKGIETVINIYSQLEKRYPNKYNFQLIGGFPEGLTSAFSDYQNRVTSLIRECGLETRIDITGFLKEGELLNRLDNVDISLLPYEDGLTLRRGSFLASLGRQIAIVTSEGDKEAEEMFRDSKGVFMCKNQQEMIDSIILLTQNNYYYEAGIENARYRDYFDWGDIARQVLGFFNEEMDIEV